MGEPGVLVEVVQDEATALAAMADEVRSGLLGSPRSIPSKYFYDERGGELFDRITRLPEYYLTRAEEALLRRHVGEIVRAAGANELVELGPGYGSKTRLLLDAMKRAGQLDRYLPVDVSEAAIRAAAIRLVGDLPGLAVHGVVGDFKEHLDRVPARSGRPLVAFLGSTIGNLTRSEAVPFLRDVARLVGDGAFLLGTDLVKDPSVLNAAYNDANGLTADFNRNILRVVNARLQGDFDPDGFEHVAFYDESRARIEMHLRSSRDQTVMLRAIGLTIPFGEGEAIRTEVSCKYTRATVTDLLDASGLLLDRWFEADDGAFALSLSRRRS